MATCQDPGSQIEKIGNKFGKPSDAPTASLLGALTAEGASLGLGNTVLVVAAADCAQNDDDPTIFDWPLALSAPTILGVTGADGTFGILDKGVASGPKHIKLGAPGQPYDQLGITVDKMTRIPQTTGPMCAGASNAAALATGAIGLMIAQDKTLKGNGSKIISRIKCNHLAPSPPPPSLAGMIDNGDTLDANAAVRNSGMCP